MQLEHVLVRHDLRSRAERWEFERDRCCGEDDVVGVAGNRVGGFGVERLSPLVAPPELRLVLRERPAAALDAGPAGIDVGVDVDGEDVELGEKVTRLDRTAADGDHARLSPAAGIANEPRLELAESLLPPLLEDLPDRSLGPLDLLVDVEERTIEPCRDLPPERRLADAHEPDQDDVLV